MLLEFAGQIKRDDVYVEALTCLLQGPLVGWTRSNEVIVLLQLRYAKVGRRVGQEDVAASQYAQARRGGEGKGGRHGGRLVEL